MGAILFFVVAILVLWLTPLLQSAFFLGQCQYKNIPGLKPTVRSIRLMTWWQFPSEGQVTKRTVNQERGVNKVHHPDFTPSAIIHDTLRCMGAPSVPVQCNSRALCHSWSEDWRHCNLRWHWTIESSSAITVTCSTARLAAGGLLQTAHSRMFPILNTPAHFMCVCRKLILTYTAAPPCVFALTGNPYEKERMMHRVRWVIFICIHSVRYRHTHYDTHTHTHAHTHTHTHQSGGIIMIWSINSGGSDVHLLWIRQMNKCLTYRKKLRAHFSGRVDKP